MTGQALVMPTETTIATWTVLPWEQKMSREELLAVRIRQLEARSEDIREAVRRQQEARLLNKLRFDKKHRLRPKRIEEGDWVLVYDSSLDHQHSTIRKFARRWFGPYEVRKRFENGTYRLSELDGTMIRVPIAGKRVKVFKKRNHQEPYILTDRVNTTDEREDLENNSSNTDQEGEQDLLVEDTIASIEDQDDE
jgi:hypothetical protein